MRLCSGHPKVYFGTIVEGSYGRGGGGGCTGGPLIFLTKKITSCFTTCVVVCNNWLSLSYTKYKVCFLCCRLLSTFYATRDQRQTLSLTCHHCLVMLVLTNVGMFGVDRKYILSSIDQQLSDNVIVNCVFNTDKWNEYPLRKMFRWQHRQQAAVSCCGCGSTGTTGKN